MTTKYCKDCNFFKTDLQAHPSGQYIKTYLCLNVNCSDPVDASPIPCGFARREATLCGLQGKYFQKKEEEVKKEGNVIQLGDRP